MIEKLLTICHSSFFMNHFYIQQCCIFTLMIFLTFSVYLVLRRIVLPFLIKLANKTNQKWDDHFIESRILHFLPAIVSIYILYQCSFYLSVCSVLIKKICLIIITIDVVFVVERLINHIYKICEKSALFKRTTGTKSWMQLIKMFVVIVGIISCISIFIGKSPLVFLSGLGAMTAVILLIFRDTILALVATLQMTLYDTVRVGDWIEMAEYQADGDVISINLHTIQVKNWDKTIVNIPTQKFLDNSFKNWRGMYQSGGRRIKRCLYIDINSIQFVTADMLEYFQSFAPLKDYLLEKEREFDEYNRSSGINVSSMMNRKTLTNVGIFRAYISHYLKNHPLINQNMTFLIRTLSLEGNGLPIQIYVFTTETEWFAYEEIQAGIFEHLLATVPRFYLRTFQNPTGYDWHSNQSTEGSFM